MAGLLVCVKQFAFYLALTIARKQSGNEHHKYYVHASLPYDMIKPKARNSDENRFTTCQPRFRIS